MATGKVKKQPSITNESGTFNMSIQAGSYADHTVTFQKTYSKTPQISIYVSSASVSAAFANFFWSLTAITSTGFTLRAFNNSTDPRGPTFVWDAVLIE